MGRIRLGDAARLIAPLAIYTGMAIYVAADDWRWLGMSIVMAVVITLIEANNLCDRLIVDDDTEAVADAVGVLKMTAPPPSASMNPDAAARVASIPAQPDDPELRALFAELGPRFAELDRAAGRPNDIGRICTCHGVRGAIGSPRRGCVVHGDRR